MTERKPRRSASLPGARGHDEPRRIAFEPPQGGDVEMVAVQVGDENGVERGVMVRIHRPGHPPHVQQPAAQHRVGEQAGAAELEQDGRVSQPAYEAGGRHQPRSTMSTTSAMPSRRPEAVMPSSSHSLSGA